MPLPAPPREPGHWTIADLERLPDDGNRYEIIDGVLYVSPAPSPSTARTDRREKRALYQRERTPEYWIVDLDARLIERWQPTDERPEILVERLTWIPATVAEPFVLALPEYFACVWGD